MNEGWTIRRILGRLWLIASLLLIVSCEDSRSGPIVHEFRASTGTIYATNFPTVEDPISEHGRWVNGRDVGVHWANVATTTGLAYGTESGRSGYDDSTAVLTGNWGSDQMAEATVHNVNSTERVYEEVELRLRSSLSARRATGYEINFRCSKTQKAYAQIVRWDGGFGKFTYLATQNGAQYGVADRDVVKATVVGNVITAYINGVQVIQATDGTYTIGSPGIGFFLDGAASGVNRDYGFSTFKASDKF